MRSDAVAPRRAERVFGLGSHVERRKFTTESAETKERECTNN